MGVVSVSAANTHTVALRNDGTVWAWGSNNDGQLGDGTTTWSPLPLQVKGLTDVVAVATGEAHTVALKKNGTVWAWGHNSSGELGDGTQINRLVPVQVSGLTDVISIAAGYAHTMALKKDGTLWTWGSNNYAQLGNGTYTYSLVPVQVLSNVTSVSPGSFNTIALKKDGTVWAWGRNDNGQLGDGTNEYRTTPVQLTGITQVASITTGDNFTLAVKQDGTIWAWGMNSEGEFGNGTQTWSSIPIETNISGVDWLTSGGRHVLALVQPATFAITTSSLAPGVSYTYYSQTLAAEGTPPYTWSIVSGNLPAGLWLNNSTGVISGTPTSAGTSSFTVQVRDAASATVTKLLSITIDSLVITATPGPNGNIYPSSGPIEVQAGQSFTVFMAPAPGYIIADVLVDGVSVGPVMSYTFNNVWEDHTISATFRMPTITATAGPNGNFYPSSGPIEVQAGQSFTVFMAPAPGYIIADVLVDGVSVGPVMSYTFNNVWEDHTISATFRMPTITATAGPNGNFYPSSGPIEVQAGQSFTVFMAPAPGYIIADVLVDGVSVGPVMSYTFNNVWEDHTISATFRMPTITATAGPNGNFYPSSGPIEVHGGSALHGLHGACARLYHCRRPRRRRLGRAGDELHVQ